MDHDEHGTPHPQGDAQEKPATEEVTDDIRARMAALRPQAAEGVQHIADTARQAADNIGGDDAWMKSLAAQGADKLATLAEKLRTSDLRTLVGETESFARRQPVLFAGAAMALGFVLARAAGAASHGPRGNAGAPAKEQ